MLPGAYLAHKKDGTAYYRSSITFQNKYIIKNWKRKFHNLSEYNGK